ncbi:MAG: D-aminoacyl-tRNA deacylase [Pseudomonadota bacterium]
MRIVVQRVSRAAVRVDGREISSIGHGLLVYLGIEKADTDGDARFMAEKAANLRVFEDDRGAMNRSLLDTGGEALVISQFTLLGDCRKGRRPSFAGAMEPGEAEAIYELFAAELEMRSVPTRKGRFRAAMEVDSVNNGPVTILIDSRKMF